MPHTQSEEPVGLPFLFSVWHKYPHIIYFVGYQCQQFFKSSSKQSFHSILRSIPLMQGKLSTSTRGRFVGAYT
jgi:hypothetical protein